LEYVYQAEAACRADLAKSTATDVKNRSAEVQIAHAKQGLPPPTLQDQIAWKPGSRALSKISDEEVLHLPKACTLNRKQRKKLWHVVVQEEGFFKVYQRLIETKLCTRGLRQLKSTKKLGLTDIQKAQRYELALSQKDWSLEEWRRVIFSDKAAIVVSTTQGH
jgi:hypothetical protein